MSSQPSPTTQISSPALMSKFSAESIKCNRSAFKSTSFLDHTTDSLNYRPGWLSNFASHLRSPTSPSGTGTATKDRESLISNPELIMHGLARPNNQLGRGARIVNDCRAAFKYVFSRDTQLLMSHLGPLPVKPTLQKKKVPLRS